MLNLHEMFIAAIKLAFKNMQNYTLQISTTINTYVDIFNKFQKEELKKYEEYMKDNFDMSSI